MNTNECIKTRRSIRNFTQDAVNIRDIEEIVETASYAPSWKNSQTTRYIAVLNCDMKKRIANECMMDFEFNIQTANRAAAIIVLTTVNGRSGYESDGSFTTNKGTHWQSFDAGIAAQTFCLAAHEKGISSVIMGIFEEEKVKKLLDIPETQSVSALIAIGYAANECEAPKRKTIEELLITL